MFQGEPVDDLSLKTESAMLDFQSKSNNARYNPNKIHFVSTACTSRSLQDGSSGSVACIRLFGV